MTNPEQTNDNTYEGALSESSDDPINLDDAFASEREDEMNLADSPLPDKMPPLTRAEKRIVSGDFLGVGTLEQSVGRERAEEVFARTEIYRRARISAEQKLGRGAIQ